MAAYMKGNRLIITGKDKLRVEAAAEARKWPIWRIVGDALFRGANLPGHEYNEFMRGVKKANTTKRRKPTRAIRDAKRKNRS